VAQLTVAFDHRVLNATAAARFLHALQEAIEHFAPQTAL
jgi:pyruvate/2-oxoglutarate dehydrogenase complex dihydrolipoamide acyltransferase (E2) component